MKPAYDVIVVGAGPAGLRAATVLREYGLTTAVVDEQHRPGGQVYRAVEHSPLRGCAVLDADYFSGGVLVSAMRASGADYLPLTSVVQISRDLRVTLAAPDALRFTRGRAVLIAAGATERPVPFPGWTLPGVMTAGAAQIALKSGGFVADDAVFAGSGPLLYLVAAQYLRAGARIKAILDTTRAGAWRRALPHLSRALRSPGPLVKGLNWIVSLHRARIPIFHGASSLAAVGDQTLASVTFRDGKGRIRQFDTPHLFIHEGIIPAIPLPLSIGCASHWNADQQSWQIVADEWGATSVHGIHVAGDGSRILGAAAATLGGEISAVDIACRLHVLSVADRDRRAAPLHRRRRRESQARPMLDAWFVGDLSARPPDAMTIVCRCEAVNTLAVVTAYAQCSSAIDAAKSLCRAGMGPCQGRMCSNTLRTVRNATRTDDETALPPPRVRAPIKPLPLVQLAAFAAPEQRQ